MTTQADHQRNLAGALAVVTVWQNRQVLGDDVVTETMVDAAETAGGWAPLVVALADLACGMLGGIAATNDDGFDAASVLDRIGKFVASLQP